MFSLCACGGTNVEKLCNGSKLLWDNYEGQNNDSVKYYALFENGTLTIEKCTPKDIPGVTGKAWTADETFEYSYTLKGNDTVIIDDTTYTYKISGNSRVTFNKGLMGTSDAWRKLG